MVIIPISGFTFFLELILYHDDVHRLDVGFKVESKNWLKIGEVE